MSDIEILQKISLQSLEAMSQPAYEGNPRKAGDFTIVPDRTIELSEDFEHYIALTSFGAAYTWQNIHEKFNNNKIKLKKPTEQGYTTFTLPNGLWTYQALEQFMNRELGNLKDDKGDAVKGIALSLDMVTLRIVLTIFKGVGLDVSDGNFRYLIGFRADQTVLTEGAHRGSLEPNITRGVDVVFVTCDLIKNDWELSRVKQVLFNFNTDTMRIARPFHFKESFPIWLKIRAGDINYFRIKVVDGENSPLEFSSDEGVNVNLTLLLGRSKKSTYEQ